MSNNGQYINVPTPKSRKELISRQNIAKYKQITKSAIQEYIESFFKSGLQNKSIMGTAVPGSLNYITDKSFVEKNNPKKKKLIVRRLFDEFKKDLPSIIIADTSFDPKVGLRGLGMLNNAMVNNGTWYGSYPVIADIGIEIYILAKDMDTAEHLGGMVDLALGALKNIAGGTNITPGNEIDQWVVRLPLSYNGSGTNKMNYEKDNVLSMYYDTFTFNAYFESNFVIEKEAPSSVHHYVGNFINTPTIVCSPTINIHSTHDFKLLKYNRNKHKIIIDKPELASLDMNKFQIIPKKIGTFKLVVVDKTKFNNTPKIEDLYVSNTVVVEKEITIIW